MMKILCFFGFHFWVRERIVDIIDKHKWFNTDARYNGLIRDCECCGKNQLRIGKETLTF